MLYYLRNLKSYLMKIPFKTLISMAMTAVMVIACGNTPSSNNASDVESASSDIKVNGVKVKLEDGIYALFSTSMGDVLVALSSLEAPMTVGNFVALAEGNHPLVDANKPYFNGMVFHRVIPNFMIQGGDPDGTGSGGPGYNFPDEFHSDLTHDKPGVLSMANSGPATNGSQFFITDAATPWLDGKHSVFGHVIEGMSVVTAIANVERAAADRPVVEVTMSVSIIRKGKDAKQFDAPMAFSNRKKAFEVEADEREKESNILSSDRARSLTWLSDGGNYDAAAFANLYATWVSQASARPSGLKVLVIEEGKGKASKTGDRMMVHYAGYFADGKPFDSSVKEIALMANSYDPQREPYASFPVQAGPKGRVIKGWQEGLVGLRKGSHVRLIIPTSLAWGEAGSGHVIPSNAEVLFDIWVEDIQFLNL